MYPSKTTMRNLTLTAQLSILVIFFTDEAFIVKQEKLVPSFEAFVADITVETVQVVRQVTCFVDDLGGGDALATASTLIPKSSEHECVSLIVIMVSPLTCKNHFCNKVARFWRNISDWVERHSQHTSSSADDRIGTSQFETHNDPVSAGNTSNNGQLHKLNKVLYLNIQITFIIFDLSIPNTEKMHTYKSIELQFTRLSPNWNEHNSFCVSFSLSVLIRNN